MADTSGNEPVRRPSKRRAWTPIALAAFSGLVLGYALGADAEPPAPLMSPPSDARPTATTVPGHGAYWVGPDVRPGTYRSTGNTGRCYWKRALDASGENRKVIADKATTGDSYVQLGDGEFFVTSGCTTWRRVSR